MEVEIPVTILVIQLLMGFSYSHDYKNIYKHPDIICVYFSVHMSCKHQCIFTHVLFMKNYEWSSFKSPDGDIYLILKL